MSTTPKDHRTTHTPTPWTVSQWHEPRGGVSPCVVSRGATIAILHVAPITRTPEAEANAEFIVRACNSHDELVEALRDLLQVIATDELIPESVSYMQQARAALQKAEGR